MALDKAIDSAAHKAEIKTIADAVRKKGGTTALFNSAAEMAAAVEAITGAPEDPHTLLLLHGDSMEDSGKYNVPLTNNGVVVSNAKSKFGGKSLYFDGNAWINFPQKYAPYMDKDFTIDWWEYCMTSDENHQSRYFSSDAGGPYKTLGLLLGHLGKQAYCGNGWSMINGAYMFNIVQNQWVHWAAVRHGNTFTTYRNGKKFAQTPIVGSIPYDEKTMHCIGGWRYSPGQKWIGYMDEFRISDIARWTSDFVPQETPYDNLQECKDPVIKPLKVTKNGTTPIPDGADGWGPVEVAVPSDKKPEQTYNRTYTQNGEYPIQPSPGQVISGGSIKVQTPGPKVEEAKAVEIKANGTTVVKPTPGKVMNQVTIKTSTPVPKVEQAKTVQAVKNGPVTVTPDPGKALSSATVNVAVPSDKKPETAPTEVIKTNGKQTFNPPAGGVFSSFTADVQVPIPVVPEQQEKEITITENGDYPITPDVGKVLSKVLAHVNVPTGGGDSGGGGDFGPFKKIVVTTYTPNTNAITFDVSLLTGSPYIAVFTPKSSYGADEIYPMVLGKAHLGPSGAFSPGTMNVAWAANAKGRGYKVGFNQNPPTDGIVAISPREGKFSVGATYFLVFLYE